MDPTTLLVNLLARLNPALVAVVAASAGVVKGIVHLIKSRYPRLRGNLTQTIAAGVSLAVVAVEAVLTGAFQHFSLRHDLVAYLLASGVVWLLAVGVNEILTDRGPSLPPDEEAIVPAPPHIPQGGD